MKHSLKRSEWKAIVESFDKHVPNIMHDVRKTQSYESILDAIKNGASPFGGPSPFGDVW